MCQSEALKFNLHGAFFLVQRYTNLINLEGSGEVNILMIWKAGRIYIGHPWATISIIDDHNTTTLRTKIYTLWIWYTHIFQPHVTTIHNRALCNINLE
uniref:Apt1 n=1 Tax=Arundo donax TaxID=35708 RepID=A0A0A9B2Z8_ARUDO